MWENLISPITAIINKLIPDKAAAAAAASQLQALVTAGELQQELVQLQAVTSAQSDINKVEAGSDKLFVAGWRPFVGWVCGSALATDLIIGPFFTWGAKLMGYTVDFPKLDTGTLMPVLMGMLGMGAMRSYEKVKGVTNVQVGK